MKTQNTLSELIFTWNSCFILSSTPNVLHLFLLSNFQQTIFLFKFIRWRKSVYSLLSPMLYFIRSWLTRRQNAIWNVGTRFFALRFVFLVLPVPLFLFKMCCFCLMEALKHRVSDDIHTLYIVQFILQIHIKVSSIFVFVVASSRMARKSMLINSI